jgi:hypothetical protein
VPISESPANSTFSGASGEMARRGGKVVVGAVVGIGTADGVPGMVVVVVVEVVVVEDGAATSSPDVGGSS